MELDSILYTLDANLYYIFLQPIKDEEIVILSFRSEDRFADELERIIVEYDKHNQYDSLKAGFFHMNGEFEDYHEIN